MDNNVYYISIENILPNINQPRKYFDDESIEELSQSISSYGILQPLTVRKTQEEKYELVAGERRFRAAKKAGLNKVPVIVIDVDNKESAVLALLENLQREDLNFLEEAEAYQNLIKLHSYKQEQLAELIGKKQSTIANKLRVLKLDKEVREVILKNNLTERHARALLKSSDKQFQLMILEKVIKNELNVNATEKLIEREILKLSDNEVAADNQKKIKGIFSPRVYMNTIKQVFDQYGIDAKYTSKNLDDAIEVTVIISKSDKVN